MLSLKTNPWVKTPEEPKDSLTDKHDDRAIKHVEDPNASFLDATTDVGIAALQVQGFPVKTLPAQKP